MSDLFYPMEANGADYPKAAVPILAQPSWSSWFGKRDSTAVSAFLGKGESFMSGRYALAEAMRRSGAGPGRAVLLPAFHCRAVVEPAIYLGAEPVFYTLSEDLRPEFPDLHRIMAMGTKPVAMVLTHYFGFPNALQEARVFCKENNLALIEDCAHALYGRVEGRLLGTIGDYSAASLWKFLPVRDGAVLIDNCAKRPLVHARGQPIAAEVKGIAELIQVWIRHVLRNRSLPPLKTSSIISEARRIASSHVAMQAEQGLKEFHPALATAAALRSSRWLSKSANHKRVISKRRDHFLMWLNAIRGVSGVCSLFSTLPEGVVPYAFPLLVDKPESVFHRLKMAGVPFWRWEDMARTDCSVSHDYRLRLLQLPCHQELSVEEMEWMIRAVLTLLPEGHD